MGNSTRLSLPVTVLLERSIKTGARWSVPHWELDGILLGENLTYSASDGNKISSNERGDVYSWGGFALTFYKDACERYWHALIGERPQVYVICQENEEIDDNGLNITPIIVSCDYDVAAAHTESNQLVLAAPIPGTLYRYMEDFVHQHYQPKERKRRRREQWHTKNDTPGIQ